MRSLDVILFCSIGERARHILQRLKMAGVNQTHVISGAGEQHSLDLSTLTVDLVICDSFGSTSEISFFRMLCETSGFFSILKNDDLDENVRWGISSFRTMARKYNAGGYSDLLGQEAFSSLVLKVATVKRCVNDHYRSSIAQPASAVDESLQVLVEREVVQAIEAQQMVPHYQPKVCLKTSQILGVEVLARWQHPHKGLLYPAQFLQAVDKTDSHGPLFFSLFGQGLKLHKYLYSIGDSLVFSYNIEACQLRVEDFAEQLIEQVRKIGLPLRFITLEITEKHTLSLDMTVIENITTLVRRGVNLSLDDFGTGFSSIARLAQLPFNQIKLDAGFVAQSLGFKESRIIESIVALSGALNLEVVAEGVETEKQRKHLELLGVDAAQGYLFYKALDGAALVSALLATTTSALLDKTRGV
ncbi:EAL domain-containing protein [Pseudomonas fragi]|uniref:EAL domain-containing protein n=1 Tax=Pseudomonas fragi TaxID=296 RepID=UPI001F32949A|nr:EAL domain-containing protein [Pseudomonas fragi]MCF6762484.1 EAL domain-containing protein [Pseudomonas fragi]